MTITNRRIVENDGPDFYPTPAWGTHALMLNEPFHGSTIWEPACGNGAMAEVIKQYTHSEVIATDLYDRGYGEANVDFLGFTDYTCDNVITNPPFNIAEEFFFKAYEVAEKKVAFLLRTAFVESKGRYDRIFSKTPPTTIWTFSERLSMYPAGQKGVKGGGTTSYSWFVWDKENPAETSELKWFPPGYKKMFSS